jgi:phospholipid/cholesterol/gamma-HCH transport system substrate-binding protein
LSRFTTPVKVGAFAIAMTVAGVMIYRFITVRAGSEDGYVVFVRLKDAQGIAKHSQVKIAGIPVGHIQSVRLEGGKARVDIAVDDDVALYDDASVAKITSSLLGEYYLGIAAGTEGRRKLADGDEIKFVVEAATTDAIMKDVQDITKDVKQVTAALARSVGTKTGEENMRDTLQNLAEITDNLNKIVQENRGSIRSILSNVERITVQGEPEVQRILQNVRETTREVRELMAKNGGQGEPPGEVRQIIEKLNRSSTSLENALDDIEVVSDRLEKGEGTLGRLSKDEKLINEVEGVAEGVNEFVGGISRLQTIVGLRSDYQFLSSTVKSYLSLRLQPREDKYYLFEVISDPKGLTYFEQVDVDSTNPNDPPHYREVRTITKNEFRFSIEFAKSLGPFTGRFGIIESTGGAGLDLLLLDDRFELSQDLFGFGEVVLPRWRITLGYEFINNLWLLAGVDDVLSPDRRDYFLGLTLRFNDKDLKSILPFSGSAASAL